MPFLQNNQILYPEDSLQSLLGGKITKLVFHSSVANRTFRDMGGSISKAEVRLMGTQMPTISSVTVDATGSTLVWTGDLSIKDYKLEFNFDSTFTYMGGNLLININVFVGIDDWNGPARFYGVSTAADYSSYNGGEFGGSVILPFLPKVTFEYISQPLYTITASTLNSNGTIVPRGTHKYIGGDDVTYKINAAQGYEIDKVIIDGKDDEEITDLVKITGTYTFENISDNHEIEVSFKPVIYIINYHNVNDVVHENPLTYTIETETFTLLPLDDIADSTFVSWYANPEYTGATVTRITQGSTGNRDLYAKWEFVVGIEETVFQNVRIYAYMNTVYIVNDPQIPLKHIEIMDMMGRTVYRSTHVANSINLKLPEGQYIVRLMSEDTVLNARVVMQ